MHGKVIGDFALATCTCNISLVCFLFDAVRLVNCCVVRLCSLELVLCAALLPISGLRLLKQHRQWDEAGGCEVHIWGAVLNAGGGQDTPAPCETSDIGPDKERWGDRCDDLPNGDREEGRVAGARAESLASLTVYCPSTMHL